MQQADEDLRMPQLWHAQSVSAVPRRKRKDASTLLYGEDPMHRSKFSPTTSLLLTETMYFFFFSLSLSLPPFPCEPNKENKQTQGAPMISSSSFPDDIPDFNAMLAEALRPSQDLQREMGRRQQQRRSTAAPIRHAQTRRTEEAAPARSESEDARHSEREPMPCSICLERKIAYACVPCLHLCLCGTCVDRLYQDSMHPICPLCRAPFQGPPLRIYL